MLKYIKDKIEFAKKRGRNFTNVRITGGAFANSYKHRKLLEQEFDGLGYRFYWEEVRDNHGIAFATDLCIKWDEGGQTMINRHEKLEEALNKTKIRGFEPVKNAPKDTKLPVRGSAGSAGYDFFAPIDIYIPARGFSKSIKLNVKAYMQNDEYLKLVIRSSLATTKAKLMVSQGTAIIDADYYSNPTNDGNIGVMFYNRDDKPVIIVKGERCCQGIFCKYLVVDVDENLGARTGGYGSTGIN